MPEKIGEKTLNCEIAKDDEMELAFFNDGTVTITNIEDYGEIKSTINVKVYDLLNVLNKFKGAKY